MRVFSCYCLVTGDSAVKLLSDWLWPRTVTWSVRSRANSSTSEAFDFEINNCVPYSLLSTSSRSDGEIDRIAMYLNTERITDIWPGENPGL